MKIYCPYKCVCWGDWITNFWAAEYIKQHLSGAIICIDENGQSYKPHTCDSSISEWADEFIDSTEPYNLEKYDYMLCTHHRHAPYVKYDEPYKKIYFDAYGMVLKFVLEDWYPSFIPTKTLIKQFEKLDLPDEYNVIHYSKCGGNLRNKNSFEDFLKIYKWIWENDKYTVSTGLFCSEKCIDLKKIPALLKFYVILKAKKIYTSLSGFTMIAAMLRKREHCYVIDVDPKIAENGVSACYTNIKMTGDLRPVYYYLERNFPQNYFEWCQEDKHRNNQNVWTGCYPDFGVTKDESPSNYVPKKVYLDIENCPLPYNYETEYKEVDEGNI